MHTLVKPAELTLINGTDRIRIRPRNATGDDPIFCKSWDLGAPETRYTQVARPGADGVTESQGFLGARTVQLELQIMGGEDPETHEVHDAYWYAQKLTQMAHPRATPVLEIERDPGTVWRMPLRGDPYSMPFTSRSAAIIDLSMTFVCPGGLLESELREAETPPSGGAGMTDLDLPSGFPFTFGLTGAIYPSVTVDVGGDATVAPIVYIFGPVTDPDVRCGNDRFKFDGLTLADGQAVQIDMGSGTIRLGDSSTRRIYDDMSAYNSVDWSVSSYWQWQPGIQQVRFYNTTGRVFVQYRERRLSI